MSIFDFDILTVKEISDLINANQRKLTNQIKQQAYLIYTNGILTRMAIGSCLDKNTKFPEFEQVFPNFADNIKSEKDIIEEETRKVMAHLMNYRSNQIQVGKITDTKSQEV